jgi:hypothetical protein
MGLFLCSEAPGLVRSSPVCGDPNLKICSRIAGEDRTAASHQSLQKSPTTPVLMSLDVNNLMLRVVSYDQSFHKVSLLGWHFQC